MKRISSIDIARGLVMVIMALDHVRDMLHEGSQLHNPTDMATTTPVFFFTRWITHLCAPTFVFLAGTSAFVSLKKGEDPRAGRKFLLSRGIWLLVLEFTLVNFALFFDIRFRSFIFEVIATIGAGFILLSFLSRFSPKTLLIIAIILIAGHDLVLMVPMPSNKLLNLAGSLLFGPGAFPFANGRIFVVAYSILPWFGIMLAGYSAGSLMDKPASQRKKIWRKLCFGSLTLFLILRGINLYGDPAKWSVQKSGILTFLSFLNVSKYPPSLLFTILMLGILFGVLALVEGRDNRFNRILTVYGRTPLFYFITHLFVIHTILVLILLAQGYKDLSFGPFKFGRPGKTGGISLASVYLVWIALVAAFYPVCQWYGRYKAAHKEKKWLRFL